MAAFNFKTVLKINQNTHNKYSEAASQTRKNHIQLKSKRPKRPGQMKRTSVVSKRHYVQRQASFTGGELFYIQAAAMDVEEAGGIQ